MPSLRGYLSVKGTCEGGQKSALVLAGFAFKPFEVCLLASIGAEQEGPGGRWAVTSQLQHTLASGRGNKQRLGRARLPLAIGWILMQRALSNAWNIVCRSLHRCSALQFWRGRNKFKPGFVKTNDIIPTCTQTLQPDGMFSPFSSYALSVSDCKVLICLLCIFLAKSFRE